MFAPTHSQLTREIRLRDVVLESFVPLSALQLIEERAQWDAMNDAWHIPGIEYAGNQVGGSDADMRNLYRAHAYAPILIICTILPFQVLIHLFHFICSCNFTRPPRSHFLGCSVASIVLSIYNASCLQRYLARCAVPIRRMKCIDHRRLRMIDCYDWSAAAGRSGYVCTVFSSFLFCSRMG